MIQILFHQQSMIFFSVLMESMKKTIMYPVVFIDTAASTTYLCIFYILDIHTQCIVHNYCCCWCDCNRSYIHFRNHWLLTFVVHDMIIILSSSYMITHSPPPPPTIPRILYLLIHCHTYKQKKNRKESENNGNVQYLKMIIIEVIIMTQTKALGVILVLTVLPSLEGSLLHSFTHNLVHHNLLMPPLPSTRTHVPCSCHYN